MRYSGWHCESRLSICGLRASTATCVTTVAWGTSRGSPARLTPVAQTKESTCFGSAPSPTMPMAMFIISTAAGSGASEGTPIKERSASTFCAKLMPSAITDESARI